MKTLKLTYPNKLFKLWKSGQVHQVWYSQYGNLFGESDWTNVRNQYQSGHHFGEWFTAIHFWNRGFRCLIENYAFKKHKKSFQKAAQYLGNDGIEFLSRNARTVSQPPDLFVFDQELGIYFFAEVKRERDRLRDKQRKHFLEIERKLQCQILLVDLKAG